MLPVNDNIKSASRGRTLRVRPRNEESSTSNRVASQSSKPIVTSSTPVYNDLFSPITITEEDLADNEWFTFSQQDLDNLRQKSLSEKQKNDQLEQLSDIISSVDVNDDDDLSIGDSTIDDMFSTIVPNEGTLQPTENSTSHETAVLSDDSDLGFDLDSNDSFFNTLHDELNANNQATQVENNSGSLELVNRTESDIWNPKDPPSPPMCFDDYYIPMFDADPINQSDYQNNIPGADPDKPKPSKVQDIVNIWKLDIPDHNEFWTFDPEALDFFSPEPLDPNSSTTFKRLSMAPQSIEDNETYPWTQEVNDIRSNIFHLDSFRPNQLTAINATLNGKDTFVLMPTGGGKSLCYQLPACVKSGKTKGVTIVVSPLLALMADQVTTLKSLGVKAQELSSHTTLPERKKILDGIERSVIEILYMSPEMLYLLFFKDLSIEGKTEQEIKDSKETPRFKKFLRKGIFARIVLDEAHCVMWDFRKKYKYVKYIKHILPEIPIMALTATVAIQEQHNILDCFRTRNPLILKSSYFRPNLNLSIKMKQSRSVIDNDIVTRLKTEFQGKSGIIYCFSRRSCEDLCQHLLNNGISAGYFHSKAKKYQKLLALRLWKENKLQVICATTAFGMGIDKHDVRFVIFHALPRDLPNYYQGVGRAGRDGKSSDCVVYLSLYDFLLVAGLNIIDNGVPEEAKVRSLQGIKDLNGFFQDFSTCRHARLVKFFGETPTFTTCNNMCDNCEFQSRYDRRNCTAEDLHYLNSRKVQLRNLFQFLQRNFVDPRYSKHNFIGTMVHLPGQESEFSFLMMSMGLLDFPGMQDKICKEIDALIQAEILLRYLKNSRKNIDSINVNMCFDLGFQTFSILIQGFVLDPVKAKVL